MQDNVCYFWQQFWRGIVNALTWCNHFPRPLRSSVSKNSCENLFTASFHALFHRYLVIERICITNLPKFRNRTKIDRNFARNSEIPEFINIPNNQNFWKWNSCSLSFSSFTTSQEQVLTSEYTQLIFHFRKNIFPKSTWWVSLSIGRILC